MGRTHPPAMLVHAPRAPLGDMARLDAACAYLADAYAHDALNLLELDTTATVIAASPVACELVARHLMLPAPVWAISREAVFVYWNATTHPCDVCGERRRISHVHVLDRWHPTPERDVHGSIKVPHLCRPCIDDLSAAGLVWK